VRGLCSAKSFLMLLGVGALPACLAFDNLPPPLDSEMPPDAGTAAQRGVLATRDAAYVCALVARCEALGPALASKSGLSLTQTNIGASFSYASCMDVLTRTWAAGRTDFGELRDLFSCVAATSTCPLAAACTAVDRAGGQPSELSVGCKPGAMRCVGDQLRTCAIDAEVIVSCSVFNERCVVDGPAGGPARCANQDSCNPRSPAMNVCSGSKISVCVGEREASFDCASIGLGCLPATTDGTLSGRCGGK
jgi:hypothetical protein